jgi:hypothetical protein
MTKAQRLKAARCRGDLKQEKQRLTKLKDAHFLHLMALVRFP